MVAAFAATCDILAPRVGAQMIALERVEHAVALAVAIVSEPTGCDAQACHTPYPASRKPIASSTSISRAASYGIGL